jgi:hypothetical protein
VVPLVLVLPVPRSLLGGVGGCGTQVVGEREGWFGTLLGPEGSAVGLVACGLLRPLFRVMRGGGGWWVCCLRSA